MAGEVRVEVRAVTDQFDAALRRSEKEAVKFDSVVSKTADGAAKKFNDRVKDSTKNTKSFGDAAKDSHSKISGFGRSAGQAGVQIQQFVGQVQGGTSAMLALSQQAADLGIVLGAPLIGTAVALGSALAMSLIPQAKGAQEQIDALTPVAERIKNATRQWNEEIDKFDISELRIGVIESENRIFDLRQQIETTQKSIEKFGEGGFESLQGSQATISFLKSRIDDLNKSLANEEGVRASLNGQIQLTTQAREAEAAAVKRQNIRDLISDLQTQADTLGKNSQELVMYSAAINNAAPEETKLIAVLTQKIRAFDEAQKAQQKSEIEARRIANEQQRRSEQAIRQIENQRLANVRLIDSLNNQLVVALEMDARKQAQLTAVQRLNETATADQRQEAERLAGAIFDVGEAAKSAAQQQQLMMDISGRIVGVANQIETTKIMTAAIGGTAEQIRNAKVEVEQYRFEQELLNRVIQESGTVTTEQRDKISAAAEAYGMQVDQLYRVQDAQAKAQAKQEEYQQRVADFQSTLADGFTNLIFGANSFEDSLKALVLQISQTIVKAEILAAIQRVSGSGGGQTGGFGAALASVFQLHEGGMVGSGGSRRNAPASTFIGAPRFHDGLKPDEFPAILQKGEAVIPKDQVGGMAKGGGNITFNITTPDADSFRRSTRQLSRETKVRMAKV